MTFHSGSRSRAVAVIATLLFCFGASQTFARDNGPKWIRISSAHFAVLTDSNEKGGKEALLRLEQMRAAFGLLLMKPKLILPEPLDVIAFQTRASYAANAPSSGGQPISNSGFFLRGADRNFIVLDLSDPEAWRTVAREVALLYLRYNYPPTQPWFDEGVAQYFYSLQLSNTQQAIGSDPASFVELLSAKPWTPIAELFSEHSDAGHESASSRAALFQAESWIVMHYLIDQNKFPDTGTYFALVENQNLPVAQAIQQAFGMSAADFEQAVKRYFHSIAAAVKAAVLSQKPGAPTVDSGPVRVSPALALEEVGSSYVEIPISDAKALVGEMAARIPEHREPVVKEMEDLVEQPETESSIAHRVLAWVHLQKREYREASEELAKGFDLNHGDVWIRYYNALGKYEAARATGSEIQGLPNMMQDLRATIDWSPDFAEAHNMLAMAQLEGGGLHAAADTMRVAIQLNPRNQSYLLNLAHIYIAQKKWEDAAALLDRLKNSQDSQVAATARGDLKDLPTLKKYGILPLRPGATPPSSSPPAKRADREADSEEQAPAPVEAAPDRRKVQYLKGKLVSVDCSRPPAALLKIAAGPQLLTLRAYDYKSLLLIGADEFSCDWKGVAVVVNYKSSGKAGGDLVSLEIRASP